jgi:hypothetical protein
VPFRPGQARQAIRPGPFNSDTVGNFSDASTVNELTDGKGIKDAMPVVQTKPPPGTRVTRGTHFEKPTRNK